jgi:hypothetical protein
MFWGWAAEKLRLPSWSFSMDLAGARPSGLKFNLVLVLSYFLFKHPVVLYYFCSCVNASLNATLFYIHWLYALVQRPEPFVSFILKKIYCDANICRSLTPVVPGHLTPILYSRRPKISVANSLWYSRRSNFFLKKLTRFIQNINNICSSK